MPLAFLVFALISPFGGGETYIFSCQTGVPPRAVPCTVCAVPESASAALVCAPSGDRVTVPSGAYRLRAMSDALALSENVTLTARTSASARARPVSLTLSPGGRVALGKTDGLAAVELLALGSGRRDVLIPGAIGVELPLLEAIEVELP